MAILSLLEFVDIFAARGGDVSRLSYETHKRKVRKLLERRPYSLLAEKLDGEVFEVGDIYAETPRGMKAELRINGINDRRTFLILSATSDS